MFAYLNLFGPVCVCVCGGGGGCCNALTIQMLLSVDLLSTCKVEKLSLLGLAFVLMLRPFFPELVISTDLFEFRTSLSTSFLLCLA